MSNPSLEPETLIHLLSHRPGHLLGAMISIAKLPDLLDRFVAGPVRTNRASSLGILHRLPPEITSIILSMLDIQSIIRFASISLQGRAFVRSHPAYPDLITFVPHVLVALGRVGLLRLHSVGELYAALKAEQCATCIEHGAFLFLPTCERCCWQCLCDNPSFRMLLPKEAKRYFGLLEKHLRQLHTLQVIPGKYDITANAAPRYCRLVSARAAKALGLLVRGSAEKLAQAMERRCKPPGLIIKGRYLQSGPATPPISGQDLLFLPSQGNIPTDAFFGKASIPFPSLSKSGGIEEGLWCRGCEVTLCRYDTLRLPNHVLATIVPPNCGPHRVLLGLERRARLKESFLNHLKHCYGAWRLLPELEAENETRSTVVRRYAYELSL